MRNRLQLTLLYVAGWLFVVSFMTCRLVDGAVVEFGALSFSASVANFGPRVRTDETVIGTLFVTGSVPLSFANETNGCAGFSPANPYASVNNTILLIERGECPFVQKVYYGQASGAKAVIIYDRVPDESLIFMQPDNALQFTGMISIPSFFVTKASGQTLKAYFVDAFSSNVTGLNVSVKVAAGDYDSFFLAAVDYDALVMVLGVFGGLSVIYYFGYFFWWREQRLRKSAAVRKLKSTKYVHQLIPAMINEMPANPGGTEPDSVNPTTSTPETSRNGEEDFRDVDIDASTSEGTKSVDVEIDPVQSKSAPSLSRRVNPLSMLSKARRTKRVGGANQTSELYDTGACTVCLDDFQEGEDVLILPCRHLFHTPCVESTFLRAGAM